MSNYRELWSKRMKQGGYTSVEVRKLDSIRLCNDLFTSDPSYRRATLINKKGEKTDIDTRLVNIDKSTSEKKIYLRPNQVVEEGDYVKIKDRYYLVKEFEDNLISPCAKGVFCNQRLFIKGQDYIPCIFTNNSYGAKGEVHTQEYFGDFDSRALITVPKTNQTYEIYEGMRFIMGSPWDIYEITKKIGAKNPFMWELTAKYTREVPEDDIENNIAYNSRLEIKEDIPDFTIMGEDSISMGNTLNYSIYPPKNCDWKTAHNDTIELVYKNNGTCKIKAIAKDSMDVLQALDSNGKVIAMKTIYTVR